MPEYTFCLKRMYVNTRRLQHPARGLRMDYENSRSVAIEEKCRDCMQERNCSQCTSPECPLFPYRPGADDPNATQRRPGIDVPAREHYLELIKAQDPDGRKATAARERMSQYWAGAEAGAGVEANEGAEIQTTIEEGDAYEF